MAVRPPIYRQIREGSATDTEVENKAMKEMRKRHEQAYRDTPQKDWPELDKKHRKEMEGE